MNLNSILGEASGLEILQSSKELSRLIAVNSVGEAKELFARKDEKGFYIYIYYMPSIVAIIEEIKADNIYPYNKTVEDKCIESGLYSDFTEKELSLFVYTSQHYLHVLADFKALEDYISKCESEGMKQPTEEELQKLAKERKYVIVAALGRSEPFKARPFFDANNRLFWMPPRNTRKGFTGLVLPYIKAI